MFIPCSERDDSFFLWEQICSFCCILSFFGTHNFCRLLSSVDRDVVFYSFSSFNEKPASLIRDLISFSLFIASLLLCFATKDFSLPFYSVSVRRSFIVHFSLWCCYSLVALLCPVFGHLIPSPLFFISFWVWIECHIFFLFLPQKYFRHKIRWIWTFHLWSETTTTIVLTLDCSRWMTNRNQMVWKKYHLQDDHDLDYNDDDDDDGHALLYSFSLPFLSKNKCLRHSTWKNLHAKWKREESSSLRQRSILLHENSKCIHSSKSRSEVTNELIALIRAEQESLEREMHECIISTNIYKMVTGK